MQRAPARVRSDDYVRLGIESELAVRLGQPLGTRGKPVTPADVAACVTEVAAAFELIEDRGADYQTLDWRWMAADNSWHAGLVLAQSVAPRDIADLSGELTVDGVAVGRGSTTRRAGPPVRCGRLARRSPRRTRSPPRSRPLDLHRQHRADPARAAGPALPLRDRRPPRRRVVGRMICSQRLRTGWATAPRFAAGPRAC